MTSTKMTQMVEWLEETQVCIEVRMLNFNVTNVGLKMTLVSCISNAIWSCQVIQVDGQLSFDFQEGHNEILNSLNQPNPQMWILSTHQMHSLHQNEYSTSKLAIMMGLPQEEV
jgi:hypothetical protein